MTVSEIGRHRLAAQGCDGGIRQGPLEAVLRLGALQAQDYPSALCAVALRAPEANVAGVERTIANRMIVRTWLMRGTLHFVAAGDVRWMLDLLAPRTLAAGAGRMRQLELDEAELGRSRELLAKALRGGVQLTRDRIYELLEGAGIKTPGQRGLHILWRLALEGLLCFGPREGRQPTFVLLDEWLPSVRRLEREAALVKLAVRYFSSHGPATLADFAWWAGLKVADARAGLERARPHLREMAIGGGTYWTALKPPAPGAESAGAIFLPGFDEFILGYQDRSAVLDPAHEDKVVPGNNGMFLPTLVMGGRVAGTWRRTIRKGAVSLAVSPFAPLGQAGARACAQAAERHGRCVGMPVEI